MKNLWGCGARLFGAALIGVSLTACSGGGGGGDSTPAVSFSLSTTGGTATEGAGTLNMQVVLSTTLDSLDEDVTVELEDLGNGTASSGNDYATLGTQVLTFPASSVDGATQVVPFAALADSRVEGASEMTRFRLQQPSRGEIRGTRNFVATIDDVDEASVFFSSATSATADESAGSHSVTVQLGLAGGVTLGVDAEVRITNLGSGTASSGSDFSNFPAQVVTFPAGSPNGSTLNVSVNVLADSTTELDETIELGMDSPSEGVRLVGTTTHQVTITDDDAVVGSSFGASEGNSGTENDLSHDDQINLGSANVGAAANAGTALRITNLGGTSMDLGAPVIGGSHAEDFVVTMEFSSLTGAAPESTPIAHDMASPMLPAAQTQGPGIALTLDLGALDELDGVSHARLYGFPVPGLGEVTLDLERVALPVAQDAVLKVDGVAVEGGLMGAVAHLSFWSGSALELEDSKAFISFSEAGPNGFLRLPDQSEPVVHLFSEGLTVANNGTLCRVVHEDDLLALGAEQPQSFCAGDRMPDDAAPLSMALGASTDPPIASLTAAECRLSIETDYQLYQKLGSVSATTNYVTQLIAAVSDQYMTDIQTTFTIVHLGVYSNSADPWSSQDSGGDAGDLLDEFRADWNANGWPEDADLAHFISGASLGGGVAYVNVLCNSSFGYGVSGSVRGDINWGSWSGAAGHFTWDFVVVAHELGHNFGASHTHSYCPPIDQCYSNCNGSNTCSQGTIMSYCHTCGGMDNIDLNFHPSIANIMRSRVEASCLQSASLGGGDFVQYRVQFRPQTSTGVRTAELEFEHDAANAPQPFRVRLRATAQ